MRLGTDTNSMTNYLMAGGKQVEPTVGVGATMCAWTDRHAGTIIKVTPNQIHVREDKATRTDGRGMCDSQEYRYESDPEGEVRIFRKTKRGWRSTDGMYLAIGVRDEHYDYSF